MKDYYNILKIKRTASDTEIKKAFRALAFKYHPDKNLNTSTVELFQEINEAYETLSDPFKKGVYDERYDSYYSSARSKFTYTYTSADNVTGNTTTYRRTATKPTYGPPASKINYSVYSPFFNRVNQISFLACFILLFDFLLPFKYSNEEVLEIHTKVNVSWKQSYQLESTVVTPRCKVKMSGSNVKNVDIGDRIDIYVTPFLRIARRVDVKEKSLNFSPHYGIYNNFLFVPLILFVLSSIALFWVTTAKQVVDLGIMNIIFLVLTVIFVFVS